MARLNGLLWKSFHFTHPLTNFYSLPFQYKSDDSCRIYKRKHKVGLSDTLPPTYQIETPLIEDLGKSRMTGRTPTATHNPGTFDLRISPTRRIPGARPRDVTIGNLQSISRSLRGNTDHALLKHSTRHILKPPQLSEYASDRRKFSMAECEKVHLLTDAIYKVSFADLTRFWAVEIEALVCDRRWMRS